MQQRLKSRGLFMVFVSWLVPYDAYKLTACRFRFIPKEDQLELILLYGTHLASLTDDDFCYSLFSMDGFYIEVVQDVTDNDPVAVFTYKHYNPSFEKFAEAVEIYELY